MLRNELHMALAGGTDNEIVRRSEGAERPGVVLGRRRLDLIFERMNRAVVVRLVNKVDPRSTAPTARVHMNV